MIELVLAAKKAVLGMLVARFKVKSSLRHFAYRGICSVVSKRGILM